MPREGVDYLHPGLFFSDLGPCEFAIVKGRLTGRRGFCFRSLTSNAVERAPREVRRATPYNFCAYADEQNGSGRGSVFVSKGY